MLHRASVSGMHRSLSSGRWASSSSLLSSWVGVNEAETEGRTLVLEVAKNETGAERQTTVTVTRKGRSDLLATVTIKQSNVAAKNGEFVIEEIYFTGTALPETGSPDKYQGDQYIKIRNNTDEDLYADGMLLILQSSVLSNMEGEIGISGLAGLLHISFAYGLRILKIILPIFSDRESECCYEVYL